MCMCVYVCVCVCVCVWFLCSDVKTGDHVCPEMVCVHTSHSRLVMDSG